MVHIAIPNTATLASSLDEFDRNFYVMPGLRTPNAKGVLAQQLHDSIRDIQFCGIISRNHQSASFADPNASNFNPLRGAKYYLDNNELDEAAWLIFLAIWFGKAKPGKWNLVRTFYSGTNSGFVWTWDNIIQNRNQFVAWINREGQNVKGNRKFGNHRKYETIRNITRSIDTYKNWVGDHLSHRTLLTNAQNQVGGNNFDVFDYLYNSIDAVFRFGRMAKFDYLCMLGKLGIMPIEPGSTYLRGATGPYNGAKRLFGNRLNIGQLEQRMDALGFHLTIPFSMQIIEDAVCNWEKSPNTYIRFTG